MKNIEWVFFDIGSTLVDESRVYEYRINETIKNSGIAYEQFYNTIIRFSRRGFNGYNEAVKYFGLQSMPWCSEYEILYPGSKDILKLLSKKHKSGIIANQPMGMQTRLKKMGIDQYISLTISSAEEKLSKPDLKIFELALKRAGCTARRSVMIGDRIDNDILPAKKIDMCTIWVKQGFGGMAVPKSEDEIADYIVNSIDEVSLCFRY